MNLWNICESTPSRRDVLKAASVGLLAAALGPSALSQIAVRERPKPNHCLVVIFLRGGADGLNWVIPAFEDEYFRQRPTIAVKDKDSIPYDGRFRLHPAMRSLRPWLDSGELQITHACGSGDATRSHFSAMSLMERGLYSPANQYEGWLAALLRHSSTSNGAMRAVSIGAVLPESLAGSSALAFERLQELNLDTKDEAALKDMRALYRASQDEAGVRGDALFRALDRLKELDAKTYQPSGGASYPDSELGSGLKQIAMLLKSGVGLEVAALDRGNWDTHVAQGSTEGWFAGNVEDVANSLAAFAKDLGRQRDEVTVIVQTEFGRRLGENVALGTDHGRGSVLMVLGAPGAAEVRGQWPGLAPHQLDEVGDLRVVNDYRLVLADVFRTRLGQPRLGDDVFGLTGTTDT